MGDAPVRSHPRSLHPNNFERWTLFASWRHRTSEDVPDSLVTELQVMAVVNNRSDAPKGHATSKLSNRANRILLRSILDELRIPALSLYPESERR